MTEHGDGSGSGAGRSTSQSDLFAILRAIGGQSKDALLPYLLHALTPSQFEELCYLLLQRHPDFLGVNYTGALGHDDGADVLVSLGPPEHTRQWIFQCKRCASYSFQTFAPEIDKLVDGELTTDVLVFFTSKHVGTTVVSRTQRYGVLRGIPCVEFWGPTQIRDLLRRFPDVEEHLFPDQAAATRELLDGLAAIHQASKSELAREVAAAVKSSIQQRDWSDLIAKLGVGAMAGVLLLRQIEQTLRENEAGLHRLSKDREFWERLAAVSAHRLDRHGQAVLAISEAQIDNLGVLQEQFTDAVVVNDLALPSLLDRAARDIGDPLELAAVIGVMRDPNYRARMLWPGFLTQVLIDVVIALQGDPYPFGPFLDGADDLCRVCRTRMRYVPPTVALMVGSDGQYFGLSVQSVVCHACARVRFQALQVSVAR